MLPRDRAGRCRLLRQGNRIAFMISCPVGQSAGSTGSSASSNRDDDFMNLVTAYLLLLMAVVLEAAGGALVRVGLHSPGTVTRIGLFAAGAAVLFSYGLAVNSPPLDFGKLLGVYVTLFFVVAQVINLIFFHVRPDASIFVGGALIVAGGLVITLWQS